MTTLMSGAGPLSITGNSGGAVAPDANGNFNMTGVGLVVSGDPVTSTITLVPSSSPAGSSSFGVYLNATASNVTGDGTVYNVVFDTVNFNVGSNFSTGTGLYTAPANGVYSFSYIITVVTSDTSITQLRILFYKNGSLFNGGFSELNPQPLITAGNNFATFTGTAIYSLNTSDTMGMAVQGFNGSKDMSILGASLGAALASNFYGFRIS